MRVVCEFFNATRMTVIKNSIKKQGEKNKPMKKKYIKRETLEFDLLRAPTIVVAFTT